MVSLWQRAKHDLVPVERNNVFIKNCWTTHQGKNALTEAISVYRLSAMAAAMTNSDAKSSVPTSITMWAVEWLAFRDSSLQSLLNY